MFLTCPICETDVKSEYPNLHLHYSCKCDTLRVYYNRYLVFFGHNFKFTKRFDSPVTEYSRPSNLDEVEDIDETSIFTLSDSNEIEELLKNHISEEIMKRIFNK